MTSHLLLFTGADYSSYLLVGAGIVALVAGLVTFDWQDWSGPSRRLE